VREVATRRGLPEEYLGVPRTMLLSLSVGATQHLVRGIGAVERRWIYRMRPLYVGRTGEGEVGVIWAAPGAPTRRAGDGGPHSVRR